MPNAEIVLKLLIGRLDNGCGDRTAEIDGYPIGFLSIQRGHDSFSVGHPGNHLSTPILSDEVSRSSISKA